VIDRQEINHTLRRLAEQYTISLRETLGDRLISVVLFGSVARGEAGPTSDIDLLIVSDHLPRSRVARRRTLDAAFSRVGPQLMTVIDQGIDTAFTEIIKTPDEAAQPVLLYLDLTEDAVILYDPHGFFARVLDALRASLQKRGAKRLRLNDAPYWDLKPDFKPGDEVEL